MIDRKWTYFSLKWICNQIQKLIRTALPILPSNGVHVEILLLSECEVLSERLYNEWKADYVWLER
jgi:hypothetical protein